MMFLESRKAKAYLLKNDPKLSSVIRQVGPVQLKEPTCETIYHSLVRSVVHQQLATAAAAKIFARVKGLFPGNKVPKPAVLQRTSVMKLRSAGLSQRKAEYLLGVAEAEMSGLIPRAKEVPKLEDQEIVERLTQIRGVGVWTAEMILIFQLGRPDVWPVDDFGVRKGYAKTFGLKDLPPPKKLKSLGEGFRPYRSAAAWYLWRSLEI